MSHLTVKKREGGGWIVADEKGLLVSGPFPVRWQAADAAADLDKLERRQLMSETTERARARRKH
jgi:hypothetical protein